MNPLPAREEPPSPKQDASHTSYNEGRPRPHQNSSQFVLGAARNKRFSMRGVPPPKRIEEDIVSLPDSSYDELFTSDKQGRVISRKTGKSVVKPYIHNQGELHWTIKYVLPSLGGSVFLLWLLYMASEGWAR